MANRWECLQAVVRRAQRATPVLPSTEQHDERTLRATGAPSPDAVERLSCDIIAAVEATFGDELPNELFSLLASTWLMGVIHAFEAAEREREG
jgi:hypothetical protein